MLGHNIVTLINYNYRDFVAFGSSTALKLHFNNFLCVTQCFNLVLMSKHYLYKDNYMSQSRASVIYVALESACCNKYLSRLTFIGYIGQKRLTLEVTCNCHTFLYLKGIVLSFLSPLRHILIQIPFNIFRFSGHM